MTEEQKNKVLKAKNIVLRMKQLQIELELLENQYKEIATDLFYSIDDNKERKELGLDRKKNK